MATGTSTGTHKIQSLQALGEIASEARAAGKRIVHCHGVFDLMHIGHIKHLESARRLGDILFVTITTDGLVNKGPHRPVFTEQLRAEALAALTCVDYVAINTTPTAIEAIELLRPHYFVKGATDEPGPRDHSDAIEREEAAVLAAGGQLYLTHDATFSATALVNRYTDVLAPEVREYLADFRARYSEADVLDYLRRISELKILTIGETIIDEYNFCHVMNKANKDPILAAKFNYGERYLGGILAISSHIAGFANGVTCLSALGAQGEESDFIRERLSPKVDCRFLRKTDSPTIIKRRYIEEYMSTKLLEIDVMNDEALVAEDEARFQAQLHELLPQHDLVLVADYGHGLISEKAIEIICAESPFLALNVQVNPGNYGFNVVSRYPKADFVIIDEPEARLEMKKKLLDIDSVARVLAQQMQCKSFLLTRGAKGTVGYDPRDGRSHTPVFSSRVVDRIGAGDACLALTAPCAALGAPTDVLGFIGNVAGAAACAIIGNKSFLERESLFRNIASLLR